MWEMQQVFILTHLDPDDVLVLLLLSNWLSKHYFQLALLSVDRLLYNRDQKVALANHCLDLLQKTYISFRPISIHLSEYYTGAMQLPHVDSLDGYEKQSLDHKVYTRPILTGDGTLREMLQTAPMGSVVILLRPFPELLTIDCSRLDVWVSGSDTMRWMLSQFGHQRVESHLNIGFHSLHYFETYAGFAQHSLVVDIPKQSPRLWKVLQQAEFEDWRDLLLHLTRQRNLAIVTKCRETLQCIEQQDRKTIGDEEKLSRVRKTLQQTERNLEHCHHLELPLTHTALVTWACMHLPSRSIGRIGFDHSSLYSRFYLKSPNDGCTQNCIDIRVPCLGKWDAYDMAMYCLLSKTINI